jgi:hypothetical protein
MGGYVLRTTARTTVPLLVPLDEAWEPYREVVSLAELRWLIDTGALHGAVLEGRYLVSVAALAGRYLAAMVNRPPKPGRRRG